MLKVRGISAQGDVDSPRTELRKKRLAFFAQQQASASTGSAETQQSRKLFERSSKSTPSKSSIDVGDDEAILYRPSSHETVSAAGFNSPNVQTNSPRVGRGRSQPKPSPKAHISKSPANLNNSPVSRPIQSSKSAHSPSRRKLDFSSSNQNTQEVHPSRSKSPLKTGTRQYLIGDGVDYQDLFSAPSRTVPDLRRSESPTKGDKYSGFFGTGTSTSISTDFDDLGLETHRPQSDVNVQMPVQQEYEQYGDVLNGNTGYLYHEEEKSEEEKNREILEFYKRKYGITTDVEPAEEKPAKSVRQVQNEYHMGRNTDKKNSNNSRRLDVKAVEEEPEVQSEQPRARKSNQKSMHYYDPKVIDMYGNLVNKSLSLQEERKRRQREHHVHQSDPNDEKLYHQFYELGQQCAKSSNEQPSYSIPSKHKLMPERNSSTKGHVMENNKDIFLHRLEELQNDSPTNEETLETYRQSDSGSEEDLDLKTHRPMHPQPSQQIHAQSAKSNRQSAVYRENPKNKNYEELPVHVAFSVDQIYQQAEESTDSDFEEYFKKKQEKVRKQIQRDPTSPQKAVPFNEHFSKTLQSPEIKSDTKQLHKTQGKITDSENSFAKDEYRLDRHKKQNLDSHAWHIHSYLLDTGGTKNKDPQHQKKLSISNINHSGHRPEKSSLTHQQLNSEDTDHPCPVVDPPKYESIFPHGPKERESLLKAAATVPVNNTAMLQKSSERPHENGRQDMRKHQRTTSAPETPRRSAHFQAIRQHHEHRRHVTSEIKLNSMFDQGPLQPAYSNTSLDRYFNSMQELCKDGESVLSSDTFDAIPEPEIDESKQQDDIFDDSNMYTTKKDGLQEEIELYTARIGGVTERLERMGIDLGFLKQPPEKKKDFNENETELSDKERNSKNESKKEISKSSSPTEVKVCPECAGLNKTYMTWCIECGGVLIGVDPVPVKQKKSKVVRRDEHSVNKENVDINKNHEKSSVFESRKDTVEIKDVGYKEVGSEKRTLKNEQKAEIFKDVRPKVVAESSDFKKYENDSDSDDLGFKHTKTFKGVIQREAREKELEESTEAKLGDTIKSEFSLDLEEILANQPDSPVKNNPPAQHAWNSEVKDKKSKHDRTVSTESNTELEIFGRESIRESRDDVPSLNLGDIIEDHHGAATADVATETQRDEEIITCTKDYQKFLEKMLEDSRVKPKKSDKPAVKSKSKLNVASKVQASLEKEPYRRKWEKSSVAWSSYNQGELKPKSTMQPRPSSSRPTSARRAGRVLGGSDTNPQSTDTASSTENLSRGSGSARRRPASAVQRSSAARSLGQDSGSRGSSGSGDSMRSSTRPQSAKIRPRSSNSDRGSGDFKSSIPITKSRTNQLKLEETGQGDAGFFTVQPVLLSQGAVSNSFSRNPMNTYAKYLELSPRVQDGELSVWMCLPDELLLHIFSFLNLSDLVQCSRVCKLFHRIGTDESLWKYIHLNKKEHIFDEWLTEIGRHHPTSLSLIQCKGDGVTANGLRELFRECAHTLQALSISGCSQGGLTGDAILLHAASRCKNIQHLDASWCNIDNNGVIAMCDASTRLESLCFNGCQSIGDEAIEAIAAKHGKSLKSLEVFGCINITNAGLDKLGEMCRGLQTLNIGQCYKLTDSCIGHLATNLKKLQTLDLRGCKQVKDTCVHKIVRNCRNLKNIVLANCQKITHVALVEISTYSLDIKSIDVSGCKRVNNMTVGALSKSCKYLEYLDISSTSVTHLSVIMLANNSCETLKTLKFNFINDLTEFSLIKLVTNCKRLQTLHLYGCKGIRNLRKLKEINPNLTIEM